MIPEGPQTWRAIALALAALLVAAAAPAGAVQIPAQAAAGFPNERTSSDPPGNAIDGDTATYTWTTESLNTASPSYLAIGFASSQVNRLRILKTPEPGGGTGSGVKNLVIQYTTGTGGLASRSWSNVPNLRNGNLLEGYFGAEPLVASAVNANGTVVGDAHNGFASLTFDTVQATGLRIGFSVTTGGTCSSDLTGPCNHYRVGELQAHLDAAGGPPAPAPPAPTPAGGPAATSSGPRITSIEGADTRVRVTSADGGVRTLGPGERLQLQPGDRIEIFGGHDSEVEAQDPEQVITQMSSWEGLGCSGGASFEGGVTQDNVMQNSCGEMEVGRAGAGDDSRSPHQAGGAFALTPEAGAQVRGRARLVRDPRRRLTTVSALSGSVQVSPANPALRGLRLVPGRQVRVTRTSIGPPVALVPDLRNEIPSPRVVRAGPASVTAPSRLSLRSLRASKCVRVDIASSRAARVLVTIFSGTRSVRLFGQRLVRFVAPGRTLTCILVPRRARTFDVRTPLSFAVGYALGGLARRAERATRPVIRSIALVP